MAVTRYTNTALARRRLELEEIRAHLPIRTYLGALHEGFMTGYLPKFHRDPSGNWVPDPVDPTIPQSPLSERERMDIARYLVDKALPNQRPPELEDIPPEGDVESAASNPQDLERLPLTELRKIVDASYEIVQKKVDDTPDA
jgi:hypothetical protein